MLRFFKKIAGIFSYDIGIDLGTANTLVYIKDQGIVLGTTGWIASETNGYDVAIKVTEDNTLYMELPEGYRLGELMW